ncbi:MAG: 16S rRNA (guanine(527)-N(7))-methyltransferase RsmG [Pyrinomonadaceae bacterium]|nr:16S rRNA (guanine(527)-N(7))-methyltransferase RsmG [Pyrinomonadaceae bacterium]
MNDTDFAAQLNEFRSALEANAQTYGLSLNAESLAGLLKYYELLSAWNARLHLVAPTSPRDFATRHILESLVLLPHLPPGAAVADIGSGAGLPIIPCLIVRPDLHAVLIEASPKKAVFLSEALREVLEQTVSSGKLTRATVVAKRFEDIAAPAVDFITCRALERFEETVPKLIEWAPKNSTLLLFGGEGLQERIEASGLAVSASLIPNSQRRFLFLVRKTREVSS